MEQTITQAVIDMASKYPICLAILSGVGIFRVVFKPIVTAIKMVVAATPTQKDDVVVAEVEASKIWKAVLWIVDYLISIKLPGQK